MQGTLLFSILAKSVGFKAGCELLNWFHYSLMVYDLQFKTPSPESRQTEQEVSMTGIYIAAIISATLVFCVHPPFI